MPINLRLAILVAYLTVFANAYRQLKPERVLPTSNYVPKAQLRIDNLKKLAKPHQQSTLERVLPTSNHVPAAQSIIDNLKNNQHLKDNKPNAGPCATDFGFAYVPSASGGVEFATPTTGSKGNYPHNTNCGWWFHTDQDHHLKMTCTSIRIRPGDYMPIWNIGKGTRIVYTNVARTSPTHFNFESEDVVVGLETNERRFWQGYQCTMYAVRNPNAPVRYPIDSSCTCGAVNRQRIVGGVATGDAEYPFMVGLASDVTFYNNIEIFCGGSLISKNLLLTAAHCLPGPIPYVIIGMTKRSTVVNDGGVFARILRQYRHEQYDSYTLQYDLGIMRLLNDVTFGSKISTICPLLNMKENLSGRTATISGWGSTASGGKITNELREVDVPVILRNACKSFYGDLILHTMFCAGRQSGGIDSCQGDSGGPIFIQKDANNNAIPAQILGVVSWGFGCADANYPGVYTNISVMFEHFVVRVMKNEGTAFCKAPTSL